MEKIGGFFDKYKNKASIIVQSYISIAEIIKKHTGIELDMNNMLLSRGVLKIKLSHVARSEIFIKKNQILKEIAQKVKSLKVSDII
jgi:hypothetical protein